jgi:pSer/pThr/pTyr-binding forkhead associated (FHA) protein
MDDAPAAAAPPKPSSAAVASGPVRGQLVLINPDGTEGESFTLNDTTSVGRDVGGVFAADAYLSPVHATFTFKGDQLIVRDEASLNGVYVKVDHDSPVKLVPGSIFRIGQEILRFEALSAGAAANGVETMGSPNPGFIGRLCLVVGREGSGNAFPIPADGMHIGRERGDVVFPEDGYVSGLHCRIHKDGQDVFLTDVGSSNGTFTRVTSEQPLRRGELLLMGQQLFRAQY